MAYSLSAAARAALAGSHRRVVKVEVWNAGMLLADITGQVNAGSVVEDETATVRRTFTLTVDDPALVPTAPGDLLHPASGNEIHVSRGVIVPGTDTAELAPLGVFRLAAPAPADTGAGLSVAVTGNDRSWEISRRKWTGPYTTAAGQNVATAIQGVLNNRWGNTLPPLTFNLAPTTVTVAAGTVLGIQYTSSGVASEPGSSSSNDPWADVRTFAAAAGQEVFFDRQGVVVSRPIPVPGGVPVTTTYVEGVTCTMTSLTRTLDATKAVNMLVVIGTGAVVTNADGSTSPGAPVQATAYDTNPSSPVYVGSPAGTNPLYPTWVTDPNISTVADAQASANAQLLLVQSTIDSTALAASADPTVDAGDALAITRGRMGLTGAVYIAQAVTTPLDVSTLTSITNRPSPVAL